MPAGAQLYRTDRLDQSRHAYAHNQPVRAWGDKLGHITVPALLCDLLLLLKPHVQSIRL
jgi:hypothetical protein